MRLQANHYISHSGKVIEAGEVFDLTGPDAARLVRLGAAVEVDTPRVIAVEAPKVAPVAAVEAPKKGKE